MCEVDIVILYMFMQIQEYYITAAVDLATF